MESVNSHLDYSRRNIQEHFGTLHLFFLFNVLKLMYMAGHFKLT